MDKINRRMITVCAAVPPKIADAVRDDAAKKQISPSELIRRVLCDHYDEAIEKIVITTIGE